MAYSDAGIRLWSRPLDDVAFWAPVRVDDRRVAVADAAGSVRVLDLLTGEVAWQQGVNAQVSGPLVADRRVVVVFDAGRPDHGVRRRHRRSALGRGPVQHPRGDPR